MITCYCGRYCFWSNSETWIANLNWPTASFKATKRTILVHLQWYRLVEKVPGWRHYSWSSDWHSLSWRSVGEICLRLRISSSSFRSVFRFDSFLYRLRRASECLKWFSRHNSDSFCRPNLTSQSSRDRFLMFSLIWNTVYGSGPENTVIITGLESVMRCLVRHTICSK